MVLSWLCKYSRFQIPVLISVGKILSHSICLHCSNLQLMTLKSDTSGCGILTTTELVKGMLFYVTQCFSP